MITNFKIYESNRQYLYHFSHREYLEEILKNGLMFTQDDMKENIYSISTTRKSNFNWGSVRIVLDTEKIKTKYKIIPVDFFGKSFTEYKRIHWWEDWDQQEERIVLKKSGFLTPDYFLQIDINDKVLELDTYSLPLDNPFNIKINIVKSFDTIKK